MRLFLLTFLLIYGCLHFYFFVKLRAALTLGTGTQAVFLGLLLLGVMAPIIIRIAERYGCHASAAVFSWVGYTWMAVVFLFFCFSILLDLYRLTVHATCFIAHVKAGSFIPSVRLLFIFPFLLAVIATGYGFFEARQIRTEHMTIHSAKIPPETGKIRIVQISDVHVGVLVRGDRLAGLLRKVRDASPDLLVATGDLVDGQLDSMDEATGQFQALQPRLGKFAVTGNHEFYAGIKDSLDFIKKSGFTPLRGEVAGVAGAIDLVGVDDPAAQYFGNQEMPSDRRTLTLAASGRFKILLKHQPMVEKEASGLFDLQLSGHTHKGQIFPFNLITRRFYPLHSGNFQLDSGSLLHVSRGTGTWGPPIRLLAPPEITVIDLIPG